MDRNKLFVVLRIAAALAVWFAVFKLYGYFVDPHLEGVLPATVRMILSSMIVPYTVGLGLFYIIVKGIPVQQGNVPHPGFGAGETLRFFVIQTGLSFPCLVAVNIISRIFGFEMTGMTADELFGNLWFYIVLLLVFNPVFEELLFRKLVLGRLGCLGEKGAVICSAVLFALPHVVSQGVAQMFYTFMLGLVWGYVTLRSGRLWPAVVLHSLSNVYCAYLPMIASQIHPALSVLYTMGTMAVMVPLTIVLLTGMRRKNGGSVLNN